MRILVDLPEKHLKALSELGKQRKLSRAALVREAVSKFLAENSKASRKATIDAAFGIWKDREFDGLSYQKKIRAEWDDR
jgi:metal-responsive CopG/Arc/MetJ family transcriptional regulator